jgi:hypothetical protein
MKSVLLKQSHEDLWLREGYLLALQFYQGWVCFRITGLEPSNVKPYSLGALAAGGNLTAWNEVMDANNRRYLEPGETYIKHIFWGVNKPKARIYLQYPTRADRWNLVGVQRTITGDVGYVDGEASPFDGPFSVKTQMFTVHDLYPAFQAYNPLGDAMDNVMLNFDVMRYTYVVLTDKSLIQDILTLKRPGRQYTVAGIDPSPAKAPDWLVNLVGSELLEYTMGIMSEGR